MYNGERNIFVTYACQRMRMGKAENDEKIYYRNYGSFFAAYA